MLWRIYKFLGHILPSYFAAGRITIANTGEYEIPLEFTPKHVWLDSESINGIGVCNGENDGFDWRSVPFGLVIIANLNSESRTILWMASS